jgi:DNA-binding CsgD family transcriptional regulator/PAS domain-containing protein
MDIDDVLRLTQYIYTAACDADQWPLALEFFARVFRSASAHLSSENRAMTEGSLVSFGVDPAFQRSYAEHYAKVNVLWERLRVRPPDGATTDRAVMPRDDLRRSEFYNDWLRSQEGDEILISSTFWQGDRASTLTLWRPDRMGAWDRKDVDALAAVSPHLQLALRTNRALGDVRLANELAGEALHRLDQGVILVDGQAKIVFANRAAEAVFADGSGLRAERGRIAALRTADAASLERAVAAARAGIGGSLVIRRGARPPLVVTVAPASGEGRTRGCAILFVKDLEASVKPSLAAFARHFELTAAQAAVGREIAKADGLAAAAKRLGTSYATARSHLQQIFQKTGTSRQAEFVRLLLDWNEGLREAD